MGMPFPTVRYVGVIRKKLLDWFRMVVKEGFCVQSIKLPLEPPSYKPLLKPRMLKRKLRIADVARLLGVNMDGWADKLIL